MILGQQLDAELAAQRVSGADQIMAAAAEPYQVEFSGWELAEHPWPSYQRADGYRVRATCLRLFLYRCAYRDGTTWHLPDPTAIFSPAWHTTTPIAWPRERPYFALSWCHNLHFLFPIEISDGYWTFYFRPEQIEERIGAADFAFTGDTIERIARERYGVGLDGLVPPFAQHDLLILGMAYRRVAKRWPPINEDGDPRPKESAPANRKLFVVANVFSVMDHREEVP